MDDEKLAIVIQNEKEWRKLTIQKLEQLELNVLKLDKELSTFKIKVFAFASMFGGFTGFSADYIKKLFL